MAVGKTSPDHPHLYPCKAGLGVGLPCDCGNRNFTTGDIVTQNGYAWTVGSVDDNAAELSRAASYVFPWQPGKRYDVMTTRRVTIKETPSQ